MDVYLRSLGCRLNEAELEGWHRRLRSGGDRVVARIEDAQVAVLNTCAVTGLAGRKSRQVLRRMHRQNPAAKLVVTGCYAAFDPEHVAQMEGVDLVIPNGEKDHLVKALREKLEVPTMPRRAQEPSADSSHVYATSRTRAFLKVQDGCRNRCTFCVVTLLRGDERSVPIEGLLESIATLQESGYQEVVLTGVHLGGYGSDIGSSLFELVSRVLSETTIERIRLTSLEPWDLPEGFFSLWKNSRLQPHLHLPLQSGCDATLRRMSRRATTDSFRALVEDARDHIPDLTLTTDLIVGFPGEDTGEWRQTMAFVEAMNFAHMHIFTYSPRAGTKAASLGGQVSLELKRERSRELHALADRMKADHVGSFVGQVRDVLVERDGVAQEDGTRRYSGYTDNYLRVSIVGPEGLENRIVPTRLVARDGETLEGRLDLP